MARQQNIQTTSHKKIQHLGNRSNSVPPMLAVAASIFAIGFVIAIVAAFITQNAGYVLPFMLLLGVAFVIAILQKKQTNHVADKAIREFLQDNSD